MPSDPRDPSTDAAAHPPVEHEIKIPVDDLAAVRAALAGGDAEPIADCDHEVNELFDGDDRPLAARDAALRIRRAAGGWTVTFKGPATVTGGVKSRSELETEVGDGAVLASILTELGYGPVFRYEKRRGRWRLGGCEVALDDTPLGPFVEIEGDPDRVPAVARQLGLDPAHAVTSSYPRLWQEHRADDPAAGRDMVFE